MVERNDSTAAHPSFYPTQTNRAGSEDSRSQHPAGSSRNLTAVQLSVVHSREENMRPHYSNRHARSDFSEYTSELSSQSNSLRSFWKGLFHGVSNFFNRCFKSSRELTVDQDLEMERERYRYIREDAEFGSGSRMNGGDERGESRHDRDRDFPSVEAMESMETSPVVSYGTSVPPAEDIEDTSEVFGQRHREFIRMSGEPSIGGDRFDSGQDWKDIRNVEKKQDEERDQEVMKSRPVPSLGEEWNSFDPSEAPLFKKKKAEAEPSVCNSGDGRNDMKQCIEEARTKARGSSIKPEHRIRFSRREKRALTRKGQAEDLMLNYHWDEESPIEEKMEELTTTMIEEVEKLHKIAGCENSYRQNLVDLGRDGTTIAKGQKIRFMEEVKLFADDVTKAAEEMARATKRRSDLFIERIKTLEIGELPRQEVLFESLIRKVEECEKCNKELLESLSRAREGAQGRMDGQS